MALHLHEAPIMDERDDNNETPKSTPKLTLSIKKVRTHVRGGRGTQTSIPPDDSGDSNSKQNSGGGASTGMMF